MCMFIYSGLSLLRIQYFYLFKLNPQMIDRILVVNDEIYTVSRLKLSILLQILSYMLSL